MPGLLDVVGDSSSTGSYSSALFLEDDTSSYSENKELVFDEKPSDTLQDIVNDTTATARSSFISYLDHDDDTCTSSYLEHDPIFHKNQGDTSPDESMIFTRFTRFEHARITRFEI
eukprot:scaffold208318_cov31-Attheya_sp.AAC.2